MARIIAIANQKGGVGKTTTAVSLAHALAMCGRRVILADLDAQGNVSACFGRQPSPGLYRLLIDGDALADLLTEVRPGLDLLPSDVSTARLKLALAGEPYRESILARALANVSHDFVILDMGPGRDLLHDMAHHAAGEVVAPVALDHLAMVGIAMELETLATERAHSHPVELVGILPQFWDPITTESRVNLEQLVARFGPLVLPAVPRTTRLREAPALALTVWEHMPGDHPACVAYTRLVERVLSHAQAQE